MPSEAFIKGFRHELANRAFALLAIGRMARRLAASEQAPFWKTYLHLEEFNLPRYQAAARNWGLDVEPGPLTRLKALLVSSVPKAGVRLLLRITYKETLKYLAWLERLHHQGPAQAGAFLDYMLAQEQLQIEMMRLALSGRYGDIVEHADQFFLKYNGVIPSCGSAA
ncbi:MAG: hypothetical protein ACQZ2J_24270 [Pseudomonas piscis]|uniref:hypothetical protein n=1 Tax=Pseudomonas piscis TaxID=2614538 RepID=UPI003D277C7B